MLYSFKCKKCHKQHDIDIKMADYDKEKNYQVCPACNGKLERVIEWQEIATSSNNKGWCGRSDGKAI